MLRRALAMVVLVTTGLAVLAGSAAAQADGAVLLTRVDGPITPVVADHLADVLDQAATSDAELVVIGMDTPGGLDTAMRQIVQDILASPIPVVVHVGPPGSRAASAGSVITLAAHVAAMAPGTNIGAATPIDLEAGQVLDKIVNDAAAYVEALADHRGRDPEFYVDTVRDGRSAAADEALEIGAIDLIAEDTDALLAVLDGMTVDVRGRGVIRLDTADATVVTVELSATRALLQRLADPNLAFVLLSMGTLAIVYEVANPGGGFGGAVGAVMLIMAFFSLSVLPVNVAGLLLIALAAGFFIAEAFAPGFGAFAGGGALSLVFAGLLLFQRPTGVGVSIGVLAAVALACGVGSLWVGYLAVKTREAPPVIGTAGTIVGATGVVKEARGHRGQVLIEGARWQAVSPATLAADMRVEVVDLDGLTVTVVPVTRDAVHPA